ncbi:MAG TPA: protein kinase [Anaerolineae bacterium]|nr:protein kinase [Anaerolineae bacterium]
MVQDPWIGQIVDKYEILSLIGHGGMGSVYRARHTLLPQREVAIKFLRADLTADPTLRERFRREAAAIAELRHPHIVQLYDVGDYPDGYYMVLELIQGCSLRERLAQSPTRLPLPLVQQIMDQTLDALSHVHVHGIVHRDLKPDNLLLDAADTVFLTDFGIARRPVEMGVTSAGLTVGTPWYMAPEQMCHSTVDCRADLYSAGVILYELLTGELPFTAADLAGLSQKQRMGARSPREWVPEISAAVATATLKALILTPDHRYQNAAEFRQALAQAWNVLALLPDDGGTHVIQEPVAHREVEGVPPSLHQRMRQALARCSEFESYAGLRALFVDQRIARWRDAVPEAHNLADRISQVIAWLYPLQNVGPSPENGLVLLLHVLADQNVADDARHRELIELAGELEHALATGTPVAELYSLEAVLYGPASRVLHLPEKLLGRDALLQEISDLLRQNKGVLLYGMGGIGKTALAARVVKQYIDAQQSVLWLQTGNGDADAIFDAIIRKLATDQGKSGSAPSRGDALAAQALNLLTRFGVKLLVLDDIWNLTGLHTVLDAISTKLPVLMTSRIKFQTDAMISVDALPDEDALHLLGHYARNQTYPQDQGARRLCQELGNHTYALEIAGALLDVDNITPDELLQDIAGAPHELSIEGRESISRLLDRSVNVLRPETQAVFKAWGAFFASSLTSDLLAAYLGQAEADVKKELRELTRRSLAKHLAKTHYDLHDMTFSYVRGIFKATRQDYVATINTVQQYVTEHRQDFELLSLNRNNVLGAAGESLRTNPDTLVSIVNTLATGGYLDTQGHTPEFARLLDATLQTLGQKGADHDEMRHYLFSKRGNIYVDLGEWEHALTAYQTALALAPNLKRQAVLLSLVGKVHSELKQYAEADACFQQGCELAESHGEATTLAFVLQQQSVAAGRKEDYETARRAAARAVDIIRAAPAPDFIDLAYSLVNLGSAESALGNMPQAIAIHTEAYQIAEAESELMLKAAILYALGHDYHKAGSWDEAQEKLARARQIFGEIECMIYEIECTLFMKVHGYLT